MKLLNKILLVLTILLLLATLQYESNEGMTTVKTEDNTMTPTKEGSEDDMPLTSVSPIPIEKVQKGDSLFFLKDDAFADVVMYNSDIVGNTVTKLGLNKCIENTNCHNCVEYGLTGSALCFPDKK